MFKVHNDDARTTSIMSSNVMKSTYSVSITNFKYVTFSCVKS